MDNNAEANDGRAQSQSEARFQQFVREFNNALTEQIRNIEANPDTSQGQKIQERKDLSAKQMNDLKEKLSFLERVKRARQNKTTVTETAEEQQKTAEKGLQNALAKAIISTKRGLKLTDDIKAQTILNALSHSPANAEHVGRIAEKLGPYITGSKDILITHKGEQESQFLKDLKSLRSIDLSAYESIRYEIESKPESFGLTVSETNKILPSGAKEQFEGQENTQNRTNREQELYVEDPYELYNIFSKDQRDFLHCLDSPEKFKDHVISKINSPDAEIIKAEYKKNIKEIYQGRENDIPGGQKLNELIDKKWLQDVTQQIEGELGLVMNQLLKRFQRDTSNKFFDELAGEDFLKGIITTQNRIRSVLQKLQQSLADIENDPKYSKGGKEEYKKIKLYKFFDKGHYVEESEEKGKTIPYYKFHPLLKPKEISLNDFAFQLTIQMDHISEQKKYLHDGRNIFKLPPGKDGFYNQLGEYAEKYSGTDIDEMMLLPDGDLALEAFQLYEKYLDEDFASLDWRHRPTEFTEQLEYVNTQLEQEIIEQMKLEYGSNFDEERIKAAIHTGVGMARAVFLTEPEKSGYADPVNSDGTGMIGSYGTNDAGALNALNPLHVELRWQGEHHMYMPYFVSIHGQKGLWDHKKTSDNMRNYFDSFKKGNTNLPDELFINKICGVTKAGGIFTRKGWRPELALAGHFRRKDVNGEKIVDAVETFKAMDYIGYEAIADFFNNRRMGEDILKAMEEATGRETPKQKSKREALVQERKKFFKFVYDKYFQKFDGPDFDGYMKNLRKTGEEKALRVVRGEVDENYEERTSEKGTCPAGSWEEQVELETSRIFLDRALVREVALRFPSKFLRIDRSRFQKDGISRWQKIQKELGMDRNEFDRVMKDFVFTETLLRKDASKKIKDQIYFDPDLTLDLNKVEIDYKQIDENTIKDLLEKTKGVDGNGRLLMTPERIKKVQAIYKAIKKNFLNGDFLDNEGKKAVKEYFFSFGVEDTDLSLMSFRGTGPRMVARSIKDTGILEQGAVPAISKLGRTLQIMAVDGSFSFEPIIKAMMTARQAFNEVHGTGDDYKFNYMIATAVINYFKKDSMAKPLLGLFGLGKINSLAAKYAGRSGAVWQWDTRDIDRFITTLESYRLLPKKAYDIFKVRGKDAEMVDGYWINPFNKKLIKKPWKVQKVDFEYNGARLRKEFGGMWYHYLAEAAHSLGLAAMAFIIWTFIKKALEELGGKK